MVLNDGNSMNFNLFMNLLR